MCVEHLKGSQVVKKPTFNLRTVSKITSEQICNFEAFNFSPFQLLGHLLEKYAIPVVLSYYVIPELVAKTF